MRAALEPLRTREFRLLFIGRLISFAGSAIAPVALAFAVVRTLRRWIPVVVEEPAFG